jgi:hypothetical protein
MLEDNVMNKLSTSRRVIRHFLKGLLLAPFLISSLQAIELNSSQHKATIEADRYLIKADNQLQSSARTIDCPHGFNRSGILNVCVAENLSLNVVAELSSNNRCQRNFEKVLGTKFCTQKNHFLSANEDFYLIAGEFNAYCPENYSRPPNMDICVEKQLSLIELNGELKLIAPNGGTTVPPDEAEGLFAAPPIKCQPGFIKPPGFHFCVANTLANTAEPDQHEFVLPVGACPNNWARKIDDGFCLPENYLHVCGIDFPCKAEPGDSFRILREPVSCPEGFIYHQTDVPTNDHAATDNFAMIPVYACVPPDKF